MKNIKSKSRVVLAVFVFTGILASYMNCVYSITVSPTSVSTSGSYTLNGKSSATQGTVNLYRDAACTNFITSAPIQNSSWTARVTFSTVGKYDIYAKDTDPKYPDCVLAAKVEKPAEMIATYRGGSNFNWYDLHGCDREPYGIIKNYKTARAKTQEELRSLYNAGQRRLRVFLYHERGVNTGTVMDSTGGNILQEYRDNILNYLLDIKSAGFEEVIFVFAPNGKNFPWQNPGFDESYFQENWNLIYNIRPIIVKSGMKYLIDLMNEGSPASNQPDMLAYGKRLWGNYTGNYGKSDTLGFSIIASDSDRLNTLPQIYNGNFPNVFDLHLYENTTQFYTDAFNKFKSLGLYQPWIIGEVFYNDPQVASDLRTAIQTTGKRPLYLLQWPVTSQKRCSDVDVTPPVQFTNYSNLGF